MTGGLDRKEDVSIAAFGQSADARGLNLRRLRKVKRIERLDARQMRVLQAHLDGAALAIFHLGLEQSFEIVQVGVAALAGFFGINVPLVLQSASGVIHFPGTGAEKGDSS